MGALLRLVSEKEAEIEESQVVVITETGNERDIQEREEAQPIVKPFIPDTTGSQKETAQDSCDIEKETAQENAEQTGQVSDTTGSTPDIFKSPDRRETTNVQTRAAIVRPKPVATLLKPKPVTCSLTFQQIKDCREGPHGESAADE